MEPYIIETLTQHFELSYLDVVNESASHNVAEGSETHFKVVLVSDDFEGISLVKRHQSVYKLLAEALQKGVHALAIHTYTNSEWALKARAPSSPKCMGGS